MRENYCHVSVILDRSGSMQSIKDDIIGGVNEFVRKQREDPGFMTLSLAQFDNEYEVIHDFVNLNDVPELTDKTYQPRNVTALLDAIGRTINSTGNYLNNLDENAKPSKVLFLIVTDGLENASKEFTREKVFGMITHQEKEYNWEFVYIGANQDAIAEGGRIGTSVANSVNYTANQVGTQSMFEGVSHQVTRNKLMVGKKAGDFFDNDIKNQIESANDGV